MAYDSTAQSCAAFRTALEGLPEANTSHILSYIGGTYVLDAGRANSQSQKEELFALAEQKLLQALERDEFNTEALTYLATIESNRGNHLKSAEYYKIVYEAKPDSPTVYRLYMGRLSSLGDEGIRQTIPLARERYDRMVQEGNSRQFRYATDLYSTYQYLGMADEAEQFRNEVSESISLNSVLESLSVPNELNASDAEKNVLLICNQAIDVIGTDSCVQGVTSLINALPGIDDESLRYGLAQVAITGIVEAGKKASMGYLGEDWRDMFNEWINSLEDSTGESARLYEIRATITMDTAQKRDFLESSVRLAPNEWHYRYRLGQIYMDLRQYSFAVEQFQRALEMVVDDTDAGTVRGWLERARSAL